MRSDPAARSTPRARVEFGLTGETADECLEAPDDLRVDRLQLLEAEAEALEHPGGEVLGDDVAHRDQPGKEVSSFGAPQVDRDAELADVVVVERAAELTAPALVHVRAATAQDVPGPLPHRILDPDDLCAERGQEARRTRPRELPAQVTYPNTV